MLHLLGHRLGLVLLGVHLQVWQVLLQVPRGVVGGGDSAPKCCLKLRNNDMFLVFSFVCEVEYFLKFKLTWFHVKDRIWCNTFSSVSICYILVFKYVLPGSRSLAFWGFLYNWGSGGCGCRGKLETQGCLSYQDFISLPAVLWMIFEICKNL